MKNIHIGFGSESGNAERLAQLLNDKLVAHELTPSKCVPLDEIELRELNEKAILVIITSSFGDGEAPGNALEFQAKLNNVSNLSCQFAVFGLGDVAYPKFCGFSIEIDRRLSELNATRLADRVDADTDYQSFFETWSASLLDYLLNKPNNLNSLNLQVKAYGETDYFLAKKHAISRLDCGEFPVYDITIDISGSGMRYRAGDLLYVLPPANPNTISRISAFYGKLSETQKQAFSEKELRILSKPVLRTFAKLTKSAELKALTKMSAADKLNEYIYGRDIADLLYDFCTPENLSVDTLIESLSARLPRAYSIASCGITDPNLVRLCAREVNYKINHVDYTGSASHILVHAKTDIPVFVRANAEFHLPENNTIPIIMIGAGTGIAPYLGFLERKRLGEMHLFFGERYCKKDFLYERELQARLNSGNLTALYTAFSRDQDDKIYVQDIVKQNGELIWSLIANHAEIYVCGSKRKLGKAIDTVLREIAETYGNIEDSQQWLYELITEKRYHQDLY